MRTTEEIIELLRGNKPDPAALTPEASPEVTPQATPELAEPTPAAGAGPHSAAAAISRRVAMESATPPREITNSGDELRKRTEYSIIARYLAFNATNAEILRGLHEAGFEMSERTLQRVMKRDDFIRYYEAFQGDINDRIISMLRDVWVLAAPEAYNSVIRLMRHAKSSDTQLKAAEMVLKNAGALASDGPRTLHVHLPPKIIAALETEGKKIVGSEIRRLQTGPVIDAEIVETHTEPKDDEAPDA